MVRIFDFRQKEVINISDGKRLGYIFDVEIDEETGAVDSVVIPGAGKVLGLFGRDNEYIIPWSNIKKIGEDIVLVDLDKRLIRKME